jgi:hypothetical protein
MERIAPVTVGHDHSAAWSQQVEHFLKDTEVCLPRGLINMESLTILLIEMIDRVG